MCRSSGSTRLGRDSASVFADALATARQGRPLHPLLLWLAGILMVIESFLARRLGPVRENA